MTRPDPAVDLPLGLPAEGAPDPDLSDLPEPRRPYRRLTLGAMTLTAVLSLLVAFSVRSQVTYALESGPPVELGNLAHLEPTAELENRWAHGEALLGSVGAVRYGRPLDGDSFRLAPVAGNDDIWVEIRVPRGLEGPRFVPPTSFVGRLVPVAKAGLGHDALTKASSHMPEGAWLLVDGDAPSTSRWSLGIVALLLLFAAFNVWGMTRILRPVKDG